MKFGRLLEAETDEAFRAHYLRYNALKAVLKAVTPGAGSSATDDAQHIRSTINRRLTPSLSDMNSLMRSSPEAQFMEMLEDDMQQVGRFVAGQKEELHARARAMVSRAAVASSASEINKLEASADELAAAAVKLDRFVLLNYTGFVKITKKHDLLTGHNTLPWLLTRLSVDGSFMQQRFDTMVTSLSDAYAAVRARRSGTSGKQSTWVPPSNFERSTTKYWVAPEDVLAVKCALVKHLPVLIFGRADGVSNTPGALLAAAGNVAADADVPSDSSLISSVYLDNGGLDVYRARLLREEGATLVRLRWYGDTVGDETEVFVERKTHHESWTTDTSVKERFRIKAKHVGAFMAGELDMEGQLKKLKSQGASDADISRTRQLSAEVQAEVAQRSLRPGLRTMYFRTAFQLSSSNAVRVSLDTQLRMLDERTAGPQPWAAWHRPLDGKHPVAPHELVDFPYAVLEVKLQDAEPKWVTALLASGRLIPCTKYSKFLHGTASLRVHEVDRLPHWWDDASVVPPSALAAVTTGGTAPPRALSMASLGPAETGSVDDLAALPQLAGKKHPGGLRRSVSAPVDFVETATVVTIASSGTTPRDDPPPECAGGLVRRLSRMCVGGSSSDAASDKPKAPPVAALKRHVPIRIEPKTFFANERTLLQWLHISILILFTALSLVTSDSMMGGAKGSGSWASDYNSRLAGAVMAPVSVIFIIYALVTYMWRAHRIARREPTARYDDRFGPCILVLLLLAVTITSIVLAIAHADWRREGSPVVVVNKYKSVTTTPAGPPLPGGAATNKSRSASLLRLDVNGRVACGQVHVAWPPFFRPRGVAMGPGDTLLVGSDYALAAVSLAAGGMASGAVQVWPATDISLTALAATPGGDVFLGSARPRNGLALYDVPARTVTHATSLDGDVLLGATQALSAMAIGPDRSLLLASGSGVEMLAVNVTRGNASAPLDWAAFRHLDGDALSVGLQGSAHIGGLAFHEPSGALLLMFDKAKPPTVRAWNMTTGQLVGDWPLPTTADSDDGAAASLASQPQAPGAASQAVQSLAPGATWAGLALGRNGTNMFVVSASPPQLWRLALGPDMLPTCVL